MKPNETSEQGQQKNRCKRPGRKRLTRKKLFILLVTTLVILTVLLFYVINLYHTPDLDKLLIRAKLAKFPESIQNLQFETRPVMDNDPEEPKHGYLFIRFQAKPNDIDNFITSSPGIDKDQFRPLRPLLASDQVPTWWSTDESKSGRMYVYRDQKYINAMVAVYDDSNTVRIGVWYIVNPQLLELQKNIEELHEAFEDFLDDMLREVLDLFD